MFTVACRADTEGIVELVDHLIEAQAALARLRADDCGDDIVVPLAKPLSLEELLDAQRAIIECDPAVFRVTQVTQPGVASTPHWLLIFRIPHGPALT